MMMSGDQFLKIVNQLFPISNDLSTPTLILEKRRENIISQKSWF
jgi:ABC-type proline/glycine betaine transport system substrate-binding protein